MQMSSDDESDNECELGKLEHWEYCYAKELANFKDHGDKGEVWQVLSIVFKVSCLHAIAW